jgi:transposase
MKAINVLGIDLAKTIFQLHGNNEHGKTVLKKQVKRAKLLETLSTMPPCLIGMEACSGASYWANEFEKIGHTVKLMAPQFVKPYVKSNKNDAADAEAIAEAVTRPNMRFVPIKQAWQRDIQCVHRARQRLIKNRTALTNEMHGLLHEYGIVVTKSTRSSAKFRAELREAIAPESEILSPDTKETFLQLLAELDEINRNIEFFDSKILRISQENELCERLQTIPGVGKITATAILGTVADAKLFKSGREFSAWLGLVPRQNSSGGKEQLLGISKRGDVYLRCMLVHGARSVLRTAGNRQDTLSQWAMEKQRTRGTNRAIVAVANKNARIIWALMNSGKSYEARGVVAA